MELIGGRGLDRKVSPRTPPPASSRTPPPTSFRAATATNSGKYLKKTGGKVGRLGYRVGDDLNIV